MKKFIIKNRGMTYVELIVVMSIFATMSSIVIYNYAEFQAKVDIKNLASDIALKVVEAQKSAMSGKLPARTTAPTWKPSYGLYVDRTADNKSFIYFTDLDSSTSFDGLSCLSATAECLEKITITKGNSISELAVFGTGCPSTVNNLTIFFKRPDSGAKITSNPALSCPVFSYVQITIVSPKPNIGATIKVYSSGRIQIN